MQMAFDKTSVAGSHAAMTCHIVVMRHRLTGVVSLGHFDNFCCWQFGENSSAHREGLDIMVEEMSTLSCGNADYIEVTVVGGYTDVRGDAERNSMALLSSLHEHWAEFYLKHFCVGKYNTVLNPESGLNEAILKGIAIDLQQQEMFPAVFSWGQYEDFKDQLKIKVLRLTCYSEGEIKEEERITADSTFKPKSLKNRKARQEVQSTAADKTDEVEIKSSLKRSSSIRRVTEEKKVAPAFKVKLRPLRPSLGHWGASTPSISGGGRKSKRSV